MKSNYILTRDCKKLYKRQLRKLSFINSQAVGYDSWVPMALKSIFLENLIFESAAWFFVIRLRFIFTSIFEIEIHEKNSLARKKFNFDSTYYVKIRC